MSSPLIRKINSPVFASAMSTLRRDRLAARKRLAGAELASAQAGTARDLERIYRRAARDLGHTSSPVDGSHPDQLVRTLRATADAYDKLGSAAAARNRSRYRAAIKAVRRNEAGEPLDNFGDPELEPGLISQMLA